MMDKDVMEDLHCKFLCCYNIALINWQEALKSISWEKQKIILNQTVQHNLNVVTPVKRSYQIAFLKHIIKNLELLNVEIHDELYEKLCILQGMSSSEQNFTFRHYALPMFGTTITLKESTNFIYNGTTGLCSWQASLALADWLIQNQTVISDKDVLELGCGTGLCGLIVSKCCGVRKVIMSDGCHKVMELLEENLEINYNKNIKIMKENYIMYKTDETHQIGTILLQWEKIETLNLTEIIRPEIILAADVIYDSSIFETLSNALIYLFNCMKNCCKLILAATVRNEETLDTFLKQLNKLGFLISRQSVSNQFMYWDTSTPIGIFIITRK